MAKAVLKSGVTLNTTAFQSGLRGLRRTSARFGRSFGRPMAEATGRLMRFGAVAAGVAAAGFGLAIRAATRYGDNLDKLSKKTGISTETLGKLAHAAELGGSSIQGIEKGTKRMASAIKDANDGLKESQRAFTDLGLSWEEMKGQTPEKQLLSFLRALERTKDPTLRAALAQDIFGRSGADLIPMLADLEASMKKAERLGLAISPEQAESAAKFKDAISDLKGAFMGLAVSGIDFGPLTRGLKQLTEVAVRFRTSARFQSMQRAMRNFVVGSINNVRRLLGAWGSLDTGTRTRLKNMAKVFTALAIGIKIGFVAPIVRLIANMAIAIAGNLFLMVTNFTAWAGGIGVAVKGVVASLAGLLGFVGGILAGLGVAVAGFKFGEILARKFDISGFLARAKVAAETGMAEFLAVFKAFKAALGAEGNAFDEFEKSLDESDARISERMQRSLDIIAGSDTSQPDLDVFKTLKQELDKTANGIAEAALKIGNRLGKPIKDRIDAIRKAVTAFKDVDVAAIDFPEFADAKDNIDATSDAVTALRDNIAKRPARFGFRTELLRAEMDKIKARAQRIVPVQQRIKARIAEREADRRPFGLSPAQISRFQDRQLQIESAQLAELQDLNSSKVTIGRWQ